MKRFSTLLLLVAIILGLTSCSMTKRRYNRGFHVDWISLNKASKKNEKSPNTKIDLSRINSSSLDSQFKFSDYRQRFEVNLIPSFSKEKMGILKMKPELLQELSEINPDGCDTIFFTNGDTVLASVIELTETKVTYRGCGDEEGPKLIQSVSLISSIKIDGGPRIKYDPQEAKNNSIASNYYVKTKSNPAAVVSLVSTLGSFLFLLGFLPEISVFLALIAFITGIVGVTYSNNNPNAWGRTMSIVGVVYGSLFLLFLTLLFLSF